MKVVGFYSDQIVFLDFFTLVRFLHELLLVLVLDEVLDLLLVVRHRRGQEGPPDGMFDGLDDHLVLVLDHDLHHHVPEVDLVRDNNTI
jgi:hypothetical protein